MVLIKSLIYWCPPNSWHEKLCYTRLFTDSPANILSPVNAYTYPADEKVIDHYDNDSEVIHFEYKKGLVHKPATGLQKQAKFAEISRA